MGILNTILRAVTWWNSQTWGTQFYTWRKGEKVGEDEQGNVFYHTADDSRVDVTLWREGDRFVLRFEDEGPGVPEAELEQIFGEFYRTDSARSRDRGGYGMGLAIARRAIVRHGGSITARNSRRGLAVTVELPAGD